MTREQILSTLRSHRAGVLIGAQAAGDVGKAYKAIHESGRAFGLLEAIRIVEQMGDENDPQP